MTRLQTLVNLLENQRPIIKENPYYPRCQFKDILRLDKYIPGDIFGDKCVIYNGETKKNYITISLYKKKLSVLRILYNEFIEDIKFEDNINYYCENGGRCCTINHFGANNVRNDLQPVDPKLII